MRSDARRLITREPLRRAAALAVATGLSLTWSGGASAAPPAPVIGSPAQGFVACANSISFKGTADAGDHVEIRDDSDDRLLGTFVAGGTGAWSGAISFAAGTWHVYAVAINPSNNEQSPRSAVRSFTVQTDGHVSKPTATPSPFSPAVRDGVRDSTTLAVTVLRPGGIVLLKVMYGSALIRRSPGMVATTGTKKWVWDGKTTSGAWATSRGYSLVAEWTKPGCVTDTSLGSVTVDNIAPKISYVTDTPDPFYPVSDGFRDTTGVRFTVDQPANVMMRIYPRGSSTVVRQIGWIAYSSATTRTFLWDGRTSAGGLAAAGAYEYQFFASDFYGNKRMPATGRGSITLSHKRMVRKSQTIQKWAENYSRVIDIGCASVSASGSRYSRGVLASVFDCDGSFSYTDFAGAEYDFTITGATQYYGLTVQMYGYSPTGDVGVPSITNFSTGEWELLGSSGLPSSEGAHTFSVSPSGRISSGRVVRVRFFIPDWRYLDNSDYDVSYVKLTVSYGVLL